MPTLFDILARHGVFSHTVPDIEPHRDDFGLCRIKFTAPGDPAAMMDIGGAAKLAVELHAVDKEFAEKLEAEILKAKGYAGFLDR